MYLYVKRILGFIFALFGLIILFPIFVLISVLIKMESKGPVLFKQKRVGIHNTTFTMYKFRTMSTNAPKYKPTYALKNPYEHITKVGKILRKTSLDELPQLYNILLGHMAFIGPRPVIKDEHQLIGERCKYNAYSVLPGLTGWAQINGRDEVTPLEKAKLDGEYVRNLSLWFDIKCIIGTIIVIFKYDAVVEGRMPMFEKTLNDMETTDNIRKKVG